MSLEAEQATVAAAIDSAEQFDAISQVLVSSDFSDETVRCVWDATAALRDLGRDVDTVILSAMLDKSIRWQGLQQGASIHFLEALKEAARSFGSTSTYAEIVKQASVDRQLFAYAEDVKELAHDGEMDTDEKLGEVHQMLSRFERDSKDTFISYKQASRDACMDIFAQIDRGGDLSGISTGFNTIDNITAGLQDSDLVIVGARPSMGKTAFMMNICNFVAKKDPVLVFSLEMPSAAIAKRSLSSLSSISMRQIMLGEIDEQGKSLIFVAGKEISGLNIRIDDSAGLSVDQLRTRVRIAARKEKPRLIAIDYLTLLKGKGDNKHLEVSYISKSLKAMAKEMSCPVICLAQLNRSLENRSDKRPLLSDLRESGSIEEDADVVMFLYRDEVYNEDSERKGILEVNIAKNRNGEIGTKYLESQLQYQRFKNLTRDVPAVEDVGKKSNPLGGYLGEPDRSGGRY